LLVRLVLQGLKVLAARQVQLDPRVPLDRPERLVRRVPGVTLVRLEHEGLEVLRGREDLGVLRVPRALAPVPLPVRVASRRPTPRNTS
jgi:hypothetical protein